jgi:serine/threonine protein phosphatase PrpC
MAGTTLVICLVDLTNGILIIGNLGDSRVLLGTMGQGVDVENIRVVSLYL